MDLTIPNFLKNKWNYVKETNGAFSEEFLQKNFEEILKNDPDLFNDMSKLN